MLSCVELPTPLVPCRRGEAEWFGPINVGETAVPKGPCPPLAQNHTGWNRVYSCDETGTRNVKKVVGFNFNYGPTR